MRLKFPYTLFRGLPVPIIPLELRGPKGWRSAWTFLDSGATFSIFHSFNDRYRHLTLTSIPSFH